MTSPKPRLVYIDNLRTVLISLVVVGHLAITYGGIGNWYYREKGQASGIFLVLGLPFGAIITASLLGFFSMIAGYFTLPAYARKGAVGFVRNRIVRLAIPLAFYEVIINPMICYVRVLHEGYAGSLGLFFRKFFSPLKSFGDGPVWYLEMLLIFSLVYTACRLPAGVVIPSAPRSSRQAPDGNLSPGNGAIAIFALGLDVVTWIVRIWAPVGTYYEPWHQELAHYPQ